MRRYPSFHNLNLTTVQILTVIEIVSKFILLALSVVVARTFAENTYLDIFAWTIFLLTSIQGWLFGTLDYTLLPIFGKLPEAKKEPTEVALLSFVLKLVFLIALALCLTQAHVIAALTDFKIDTIGSFGSAFAVLAAYLISNSMFCVLELILNQRSIFILPALLKGVFNPGLITLALLTAVPNKIIYYANFYFLSSVASLALLIFFSSLRRIKLSDILRDNSIGNLRIFFSRGYPLFFGQILNSVGEFASRYYLSGSTMGTLFFYGVAQKLVIIAHSLFGQTIIKIGFAEICKNPVEEKFRRNSIYLMTLRSIYIFGVLLTIFLFLSAELLISVFYGGGKIETEQTDFVIQVFQILSLSIVPASIHALNWRFLTYLDKTTLGMYLALPSAVITTFAYSLAVEPIHIAYIELLLCVAFSIFYSSYALVASDCSLTAKDLWFVVFVPVSGVLSAALVDSVLLFFVGEGSAYTILSPCIFIAMSVILVMLARELVPFAFSDFRKFYAFAD